MTDRELLGLAAKAVGEPYFEHAPDGGLYLSNGEDWNPLTDDGDALRLAVKLSIDVNHGDSIVVAERVRPVEAGVAESKTDDPYAATRRAIVRAAAEIGRSKT
jgi:hypothetical protein